jgi:hypothetical protein
MSKPVTMREVREAITHYQSVQAKFGDDDLSDEYFEAIGDVPNYHIRDDGSVICFGDGGKQIPVVIVS